MRRARCACPSASLLRPQEREKRKVLHPQPTQRERRTKLHAIDSLCCMAVLLLVQPLMRREPTKKNGRKGEKREGEKEGKLLFGAPFVIVRVIFNHIIYWFGCGC